MSKGNISPASIIFLVVGILVGMYVLQATFLPMQSASTVLSTQMGAPIANETIGTANSTGDGTFYTLNKPVAPSTWTVYANGTDSAVWVNSTVAVTLASGQVVVAATGTSPTTAGAIITMSYSRDSGIAGMSSLSGLPGVAVLLFMLLVVISFIMMAIKAME